MKVVMVTGSYPPDTCGVGDFTAHLVEVLLTQGIGVEVVSNEKWVANKAFYIRKRISSLKPDIVHIQYPTIGYGTGLAPQLISCMRPCIITLHEISQTHILRRVALLPFSMCSQHIIFTNSYERGYALRWTPWISSRSSVIPIGSSMAIGYQNRDRDLEEIVYFGIIRPDKGLEDIITLALLIKENDLKIRIRIIGKPHPKYPDYFQMIYRQSKDLPIMWNLGLTEGAVVDLLSRSLIAYVPFPDGASERRSSLFALMSNGVNTITTKCSHTPPEMDRAVLYASTPKEALHLIQKLSGQNELQVRLRHEAVAFVNNYSWESIAAKHIELYKLFLAAK
jgi:glycosyltransferase involved in cell wall biosynthesis